MEKDNRVSIEIELDNETLFQLMLMAHEQDITFNKLVENCLREYLDRYEQNLQKGIKNDE